MDGPQPVGPNGRPSMNVAEESMGHCDEDPETIPIYIEVCQRSTSTLPSSEVQSHVRRTLQSRSFVYSPGILEMPADDEFVNRHIESVLVTDTNDNRASVGSRLLFWQVRCRSCYVQASVTGPFKCMPLYYVLRVTHMSHRQSFTPLCTFHSGGGIACCEGRSHPIWVTVKGQVTTLFL